MVKHKKTVAVRPGWAVVPRKAADETCDSEAKKTEAPLRSTTDSRKWRPKSYAVKPTKKIGRRTKKLGNPSEPVERRNKEIESLIENVGRPI